MNNTNFDKAVNFLQGALDLATSEARQSAPFSTPTAEATPVPPAARTASPTLPGFEDISDTMPPPPKIDEIIPPCEADSPPPESKKKKPSNTLSTCTRAQRFKAAALVAAVLGISFAVTLRLVRPRVEIQEIVREVQQPDSIPLELLPETADAALWEIVSEMSGSVDGKPVNFHRGIALLDNGGEYRLCLDFCRCGTDIYAKIAGDKTFVVKVSDNGEILRSYPAPKGNKPLIDLFKR